MNRMASAESSTIGSESVGTPLAWIGFSLLVLVMLALDLGVFHRKAHEVSVREAFIWTFVWITLAMLFNAGVYHAFGQERAFEFFTGYVIEKALSVDNIFVFLVVFSTFAVPAKLQHRILFWGILGALVMRGIFIFLGAAVLHRFHWVSYVFGAFLVFTGAKLLRQRDDDEVHPERNPLFRLFQRLVPSVSHYRSESFTVVENDRRHATPLLLVLVAIETTDIVFAVDSIRHRGPVHRLHVEHLRHPRSPSPVLRPRRSHRQGALLEGGACPSPRVRGNEDARRVGLQDSDPRLPRRDRDAARRRGRRFVASLAQRSTWERHSRSVAALTRHQT
jgi:TerC family integral membrane protein